MKYFQFALIILSIIVIVLSSNEASILSHNDLSHDGELYDAVVIQSNPNTIQSNENLDVSFVDLDLEAKVQSFLSGEDFTSSESPIQEEEVKPQMLQEQASNERHEILSNLLHELERGEVLGHDVLSSAIPVLEELTNAYSNMDDTVTTLNTKPVQELNAEIDEDVVLADGGSIERTATLANIFHSISNAHEDDLSSILEESVVKVKSLSHEMHPVAHVQSADSFGFEHMVNALGEGINMSAQTEGIVVDDHLRGYLTRIWNKLHKK